MKVNNNYLLLGPERGKREEFIEKIVEGVSKYRGETPEVYRYYPFEMDINEVISLLQNEMLFVGSKVVIINNIDELKEKKAIEKIVSYCKQPNGSSVLIMTSDTMSIPAQIKNVIPQANIKKFWEMYESDKRGWVVNYFKRWEIEIEHRAVDSLLELVENNTEDLKAECEKLALFFSKKGFISAEDVEEYLYHSKEENVFTLFKEMAEKDLEGVLEILSKIMLSRNSGSADQLIMGILWQVEKLYKIKFYITMDSRDVKSALQLAGIRGFKSENIYKEALKKYSLSEIERIVKLIHDTEVALRSTASSMHEIILQLFFYRVIGSHNTVGYRSNSSKYGGV